MSPRCVDTVTHMLAYSVTHLYSSTFSILRLYPCSDGELRYEHDDCSIEQHWHLSTDHLHDNVLYLKKYSHECWRHLWKYNCEFCTSLRSNLGNFVRIKLWNSSCWPIHEIFIGIVNKRVSIENMVFTKKHVLISGVLLQLRLQTSPSQIEITHIKLWNTRDMQYLHFFVHFHNFLYSGQRHFWWLPMVLTVTMTTTKESGSQQCTHICYFRNLLSLFRPQIF